MYSNVSIKTRMLNIPEEGILKLACSGLFIVSQAHPVCKFINNILLWACVSAECPFCSEPEVLALEKGKHFLYLPVRHISWLGYHEPSKLHCSISTLRLQRASLVAQNDLQKALSSSREKQLAVLPDKTLAGSRKVWATVSSCPSPAVIGEALTSLPLLVGLKVEVVKGGG